MRYLAASAVLFTLAGSDPVTGGHRRLGPVHRVFSTAYCYGGTTASGHHTRFGYIASNQYRLGTRLRLVHPRYLVDWRNGHRRRTVLVMDRGAPFDVWVPPGPGHYEPGCGWGRKWISYRVVR